MGEADAHHYLQVLQEAESELKGPKPEAWFGRLEEKQAVDGTAQSRIIKQGKRRIDLLNALVDPACEFPCPTTLR